MKYIKNTAAIFIALCYISAFAQTQPQTGITMQQTIEFLNKKMGSGIVISLAKNEQIVISFYKNGAVYKIDKIYLETLDSNKVSFSAEEKALILRCKSPENLEGKMKKFKDGCVEREIIDKEIIGAYGRCNLEIGTDKKKIASVQKAIIHLIKLAQNEEYSSSIPFE